MNDPIRQRNEPMQPSPDYSDIFELNSVFTDFWNSHIDATITSAYVAKENEPDFTENLDKYFAKALNLRGEISHTQASIGFTTVSDSPCELFQRDPFITSLNDLEKSLSDLVDPEHMDTLMALVGAVAGKSNGVSADKLWPY